MRLYTVLLYFCETAVHVSDDTLIHHQEHTQTVITSGTALIHHQEHTQTVITTSGTGRTVFATVRGW